MTQAYSNQARATDDHALPNIEVFELTAHEIATMDEDAIYEFGKIARFQLHNMNGKVREAMLDAIVEEMGITGGWFWWACFPGCLPDGDPMGPFESHAAALADAQAEGE